MSEETAVALRCVEKKVHASRASDMTPAPAVRLVVDTSLVQSETVDRLSVPDQFCGTNHRAHSMPNLAEETRPTTNGGDSKPPPATKDVAVATGVVTSSVTSSSTLSPPQMKCSAGGSSRMRRAASFVTEKPLITTVSTSPHAALTFLLVSFVRY